MASVQTKLSGAILSTIRARRESAEKLDAKLPTAGSAKLRQAEMNDFAAVAKLASRLGQGSDSEANWRRLWLDNPTVKSGLAPARIGWVLEAGSEVVGFLGNIPLLCELEGKTLVAAATCRFAVAPEFRALSHLLVASFLRQKDVDLFLNTTATPAAAKIMVASKASVVPQPDYGKVLFWILNRRRFVETVLRRVGFNSRLLAPVSAAGGVSLAVEMAMRRKSPAAGISNLTIQEHGIDNLPADIDQFFQDAVAGKSVLFSQRNSETLRWHFTPPESRRVSRAFVCRDGETIKGYTVVRQEREKDTGLVRSLLADLIADNHNPLVIQQLFTAAYNYSKASSSDVLEVVGFPSAVRKVLNRWKPYTREYPACPYYFKARDKDLHQQLQSPSVWYACPYDGDATLWP
jgi:hypothetical protein